MEFDWSAPWETVQRLANGFVAFLPRLVAALLIVAVFYVVAKLVRAVVHRAAARRREHPNLERAFGRIAQAGLVVLGLLVAAAAAFPTFTPGDLISALGIGSLAAGFAFKDILQNFLAGILILVTKPFLVGDQIVFGSYEGTVEDIQTRATYLKTYDGRRVVIPNGELFTNSVTVNTAFAKRRMEYDIGIGYGDDVERAKALVLQVLERAEGVLPDPKADVIVVALDESSVNLRARWWTNSYIADVLIGQDKVLSQVKATLQENGIDIPFPTRQVLFHDQTESTDGDRRRQREGWPAGRGDVPPARSIAAAIQRLEATSPNGSIGHAAR
jgi:small conductance mechanosensitive channel